MRFKTMTSLWMLALGLAATGQLMAADSKPAPAAAPAATQVAKLTAVQVVERNIAARGGSQAWRDVQTMSWSGKMEAGTGDTTARSWRYTEAALMPKARSRGSKDKNGAFVLPPNIDKPVTDKQVELPFVLDMQRPHKSRLEIQFAGKTAIQVYDGSQGWKVRPFLNRTDVQPFTKDEAKAEASQSGIDGPLLDYAARGTKVTLEGVEAVDGSDAYKLSLKLKDGTVRHVWIDAKSFLDVQVEGSPRFMDGRLHTVLVAQRDFRKVQGVMLPFALETMVDGYPNTHKMQIEKAQVNPRLDASLFAKPNA